MNNEKINSAETEGFEDDESVEKMLDSVKQDETESKASILNARNIYRTSWLGKIQETKDKIEGSLPRSDKIVIHVHGWRNSRERGTTNAEDVRKAYSQTDYCVSGLIWSSDDTWWNAKEVADRTGRKLAEFLVEQYEENPEASIRLQGHSLGCRVISETVHSLHSMGEASVVDEVVLLGGAVDCRKVQIEGRYGKAFEESVDSVWSFFFKKDIVLRWIGFYERSHMIGRRKSRGELASNFTEIEFDAEHHRGYYRINKMQEILSIIDKAN